MNYNNYGQPPQNLMQWGRGYGQQPQQAQQPQKFTQSMLTQAAAAAPVAQAAPTQAPTQFQLPVNQQAAQPQTQPPPQPPPPPQPGKINWNTIRPKAYDGTMTGGGGTWDNAVTRRLSQNNAVPNQ